MESERGKAPCTSIGTPCGALARTMDDERGKLLTGCGYGALARTMDDERGKLLTGCGTSTGCGCGAATTMDDERGRFVGAAIKGAGCMPGITGWALLCAGG